MARADRAELLAGDGMARDNGLFDVERVYHCQHIVTQPVGVVIFVGRRGQAGSAKTTAGDGIDVMVGGEFRREAVKDMAGAAKTGEQHQRPAAAAPNWTTEVKDFKP